MEDKKKFNGGLNQDVSPLDLKEGEYKDARNIRIINDVAGTSSSITNILGNTFNLVIPNTTLIQKISIGTAGATNITIDGQTGAGFDTTSSTPKDIYDNIITDTSYNECFQNPTSGTKKYNVFYGNNYIVIQSLPTYTIVISVSNANLVLNATYVPIQTNLEPIGHTTIRGDMYIFTTNNTTLNPGGHDSSLSVNASSVGQIWKYTYDKITLAGTIQLIYNNYIDFSTYWAIAPSATTGRYENSAIQRVYWTDFFNKLRTINVADPQSLAIDPTELDITPSVNFDIPILQTINNAGSTPINVGVYQTAYRLTNTGGSVTNYSELSNMVFVVTTDEAGQVAGAWTPIYNGSPATATVSKAMTWQINNIDTRYDRIQIVILERNLLGVPTIYQIFDDPINNGSSYSFTYDGSQTKTPVTLDSFLAGTSTFTKCKTIATKDNRLFVGNVKNEKTDISFDARAFRAYTSGGNNIKLTNNGTNATYTLTAAKALLETQDTINDYSNSSNASFFKPGVANVLGGTGANISYEFYTVAVLSESSLNSFDVNNDQNAPWRLTYPNAVANQVDLGVKSSSNVFGVDSIQEYPLTLPGKINDGIKYPPMNSLYRGYQRTEIYRFGIQFFDKAKNPLFVKWIGDIKMPDFYDNNTNSYFEDGAVVGLTDVDGNTTYPNATSNSGKDFRSSFVYNRDSTNASYIQCYTQELGVQFTVTNLNTISDKIGGYSIVRVQRTNSDKTIINQGYTTRSQFSSNSIYTTDTSLSSDGNTINISYGFKTSPNKGFFVTPDINSSLRLIPEIGQRLVVKSLILPSNGANSMSYSGGDPYYYYKLYKWKPETQTPTNLTNTFLLGYAGNGVSGTYPVFNYDFDTTTPTDTISHSIGNSAYYYELDGGGIDYTNISNGKFICNIERTLSDQYGGATYTARSNNEYISCNHYRPLRSGYNIVTDTFEAFGGDTFINIYDSCRWAKNWGSTGRGTGGLTKISSTFFVPVESFINTDLRYGTTMNYNISSNYDTGVELVETNMTNEIYTAEEDIRTFFPKPDPFLLNDEFDNRIYASEIKINGELTDNWGVFKVNNYWDVEGTYGPINILSILRDKMYLFQDRAFGIIEINPRSLITDINNGVDLQVGTGLILQRHDYISTEVGCQHQWGITKSSYKFFWTDVKIKKFFTYGQGEALTPESDIKGLFSFFSNNLKNNILNFDKPIYESSTIGINGIRAVYDFKYNQAIFTYTDGLASGRDTFTENDFTIALDEKLNTFSTFYDYTPKMYITDFYKILSPKRGNGNRNRLYMHDLGNYCEFYDVVYNSKLTFISNQYLQENKVFDNMTYDSQSLTNDANHINKNNNTWTTIRCYNDYQNTDFQSLLYDTNIKRKERTWKLAIPRNRVLYTSSNSPNIFTDLSVGDKPYGERMRDKFLTIDLINNNSTNELLVFNNATIIYRSSAR